MKKTLLLLIISALFPLFAGAQSDKLSSIPDHPITQGISAPFAGFVGDWLIVGGGCNFPDIPAANGGTKVYYRECYAFDTQSSSQEWIRIGNFPVPVAYGSAAETEYGLVCVGGINADSCLTSAYLIKKKQNEAGLSILPLPSLPNPVDNASATAIGNFVYLTGGNQKSQGKHLYRLNLDCPSVWEELPAYPGPQRIQPILVNDRCHLFLAGGFQPPSESEESILSDNILRFDPKEKTWQFYSDIPDERNGEKRCLVGGTGTQTISHLILTGGVNYEIFKNAIEGKSGSDYMRHHPSWYKFNDDLLLYDFRKGKWLTCYDIEGMARAGGVLLYHNECLYMVCGEIKPGIRSSKIIIFPLSKIAIKQQQNSRKIALLK